MDLSPQGCAEIGSYEGVCLRPYFDSVGVLTWGIGHTWAAGAPDPRSLPRDQDQPMDRVIATFRSDMSSVVADVNRLVTVALQQNEFDALCSFHFNTGGLARAQLLVALNAGNRHLAAIAFMGWLKPPEIEGRRTKEQILFRDGVYSSGGKANLFPVSPNGQPLYGHGKVIDLAALFAAPPNEAEL